MRGCVPSSVSRTAPLDVVQEVATALSLSHLPGILLPRRLRCRPVGVGFDDIVEQVEVWSEPEHAVAVTASDCLRW
jgi:hypothetical protein